MFISMYLMHIMFSRDLTCLQMHCITCAFELKIIVHPKMNILSLYTCVCVFVKSVCDECL